MTIRWKVPASVSGSATAHTVRIYRSTSGEDGDYQLATTLDAGGGNSLSTYTGDGNIGDYFYIRYVPAGGSEGDRIIAFVEPGVKEQRLAEQISSKLPEIVKARIDSNLIDIRQAMTQALGTVNAYSPTTSYAFTNLPARLETCVVIITLMLLYIEHQLQISMRDYAYSGTGVSFTVDRNAKFASTLSALQKSTNELLDLSKKADWPSAPLGLGTTALSTPQGRIMGNLWGSSPDD